MEEMEKELELRELRIQDLTKRMNEVKEADEQSANNILEKVELDSEKKPKKLIFKKNRRATTLSNQFSALMSTINGCMNPLVVAKFL